MSVTDIEAGWPDAARHLDRERDKLAAYPHTLVLWIQSSTRGRLAELAPNFFSRHGGVFDLRLPTTGTVSESLAVTQQMWQQAQSEEGTRYESLAVVATVARSV